MLIKNEMVRQRITDEQVAEIIKLRDSGHAWGAIGTKMKLSDSGAKTAYLRAVDPEEYERFKAIKVEQYNRRTGGAKDYDGHAELMLWVHAHKCVMAASRLMA